MLAPATRAKLQPRIEEVDAEGGEREVMVEDCARGRKALTAAVEVVVAALGRPKARHSV